MRLATSDPTARRSSAIEKALFALARAETHQQKHERGGKAQMVYADDKLVSQIIERGNAPVGMTGTSGWASQATQNLIGDFVSTLAPVSAAAAIISRGLSVRMAGAVSMKLPAREGAPSTASAWTGEAEPIQVRSYVVNDDCELVPKKFGFIIGISKELAKRANGESVVRQLLREDAGATLDAAYFSADAGSSSVHKGMRNGVTAVTGEPGGDRIAMERDLRALSDVVSAAGSGEVVFIVAPKRAMAVKILAPDLSREITVLPSLAVADAHMIAVDPLSWAHGFGDEFDIDVSEEATLHQSDVPVEVVSDTGPTTADPVRGYWQTNSVALRLLADVAFAARRPNAVAWAQGLTW